MEIRISFAPVRQSTHTLKRTMKIPKGKSLAVAYSLFAILGLQGVHQFYLGNYLRGLAIAGFIHVPMFAFAYMVDKAGGNPNAVGPMFGLMPLLALLIGLMIGFGLFIVDLFTLKKQIHRE